jgi:hypothetical protein
VDVKVCLKEVHELVLNKVNLTLLFGNKILYMYLTVLNITDLPTSSLCKQIVVPACQIL